MKPLDLLIIGNGHYVSGMTSVSGQTQTDKDKGVLLPAALALRSEGLVNHISVAARDAAKLDKLKSETLAWGKSLGLDGAISVFAGGVTVEGGIPNSLESNTSPQLALIAVPDHMHVSAMKACIDRGIHFLIVKPSVTRLEQYYEVLDAAEKNNVLGIVDFHKVYDEANLFIRDEIDSEKLGSIQHVYSLMTQKSSMLDIYSRWLTIDAPPNINHYLGSHYAHLVGFISRANPIDVRARQHFGKAQKKFGKNIADLIDMQVTWRQRDGHIFTSHHISGWSDPKESESMTYQELHIRCEKGSIDSDQRYRGTRALVEGLGYEVPNPYFFRLSPALYGGLNLNTKYGYISVKTFILAAAKVINGSCQACDFDSTLPTLKESDKITAILEAADVSISNESNIVSIENINGRYTIRF